MVDQKHTSMATTAIAAKAKASESKTSNLEVRPESELCIDEKTASNCVAASTRPGRVVSAARMKRTTLHDLGSPQTLLPSIICLRFLR